MDGKCLTRKQSFGLTIWKVMRKRALRGIAKWQKWLNPMQKVSTLCLDDHHFKRDELETVGELSIVRSHIINKCQYLDRSGRPGIHWSVNKLARAVTRWTRACDRRLARLISYMITGSAVMCEIQPTIADCDFSRIQILPKLGRSKNSTTEKCFVLSGVERSFPKLMCNKPMIEVQHTLNQRKARSNFLRDEH